MKIRRRLFGLTVSCILFFSGCAPATPYPTGNAYHEGTDFQYAWTLEGDRIFTQSEDGYYFVVYQNSGGYLYFTDKTTLQTVPLCSKPNCMHALETDDEKKDLCDARISPFGALGYIDEKVYYVCNNGPTLDILQINPDGTDRKVLHSLTGQVPSQQFAFHRGKMYVAVKTYDEDMNVNSTVWSYSLRDASNEPEKLCELPTSKGSIDAIYVYGNYLYASGVISSENEYERSTIYRLNLSNKKLTAQLELEEPDTTWCANFIDGKFMTSAAKSLGAGSFIPDQTTITFYQTDLDGNNQHKWAELPYSHYTSDNQYLYMWNWPSSDIPMEDKTLTIYDKDANTVDRLPIGKLIPNYSEVYVSPGEHVFIYAKDEGMYAFPKSEIGSGNITPVQILEIPDETA